MDFLFKCDAAVWEAAKGTLTASQQAEIEEKRRGAVDQPTAHSARKQLEQEVAALSKLESAYQRQHKAAVDACVLLAETGGKVKEQKTRVQGCVGNVQRSGSPPCRLWGETRPRFCRSRPQQSARGSSNATDHPESATRTFLVTLGQLHSYFPNRRSPQHRVRKHRNRQHHKTHFRPRSQPPFPVSQAQQGAGWMQGRRVLVLVVLFMALVAIIRQLNQSGPLQWQKGENGCRRGLRARVSTTATAAALQFTPTQHQPASPGTARFFCFIASCCHV